MLRYEFLGPKQEPLKTTLPEKAAGATHNTSIQPVSDSVRADRESVYNSVEDNSATIACFQ